MADADRQMFRSLAQVVRQMEELPGKAAMDEKQLHRRDRRAETAAGAAMSGGALVMGNGMSPFYPSRLVAAGWEAAFSMTRRRSRKWVKVSDRRVLEDE